jgi:hypothetical protein
MTEVLTAVAALCVFLVLYEALRRRSARHGGTKPVVQWLWVAAIVGCAALALAVALVRGG